MLDQADLFFKLFVVCNSTMGTSLSDSGATAYLYLHTWLIIHPNLTKIYEHIICKCNKSKSILISRSELRRGLIVANGERAK